MQSEAKNNKNHPTLPPLAQAHLSETLGEHPLMQWIANNGKILLYALLGLVALFIAVLYFSFTSRIKAENDYLNAEKAYKSFASSTNTNSSAPFNELNAILNREPDLHAKYDGLIAQVLLSRGQVKEAQLFANSALKRTAEENAPYYTDFTKISLIIGNGEYPQALENSEQLKQKMLSNASLPPQERLFDDELFSLNLLRIGFLNQQLQNPTAELQTWQEWKQYAGLSKEPSPNASISANGFKKVISQWQENQISLLNYINSRETALRH